MVDAVDCGGRQMKAYYNEFDPKAAAWLRQLIGVPKIGLVEFTTDDIVRSPLIRYQGG